MGSRPAPGKAGNGPSQFVAKLAVACADGVYAVDAKQRVVFWSETAEKLTGHRREAALGRPCYEVMLGQDSEGHGFCRLNCPTIALARRGRTVPSYDLRAATHDGRPAWFNVSIVPLHGDSPTETLVVHLFRDVTMRRRAEALAEETVAAVTKYAGAGELSAGRVRTAAPPTPELSPREVDVLELMRRGLGTMEMAGVLCIRPRTVRNHVDRLLAKLGVHSRLEAVLRATELGLA